MCVTGMGAHSSIGTRTLDLSHTVRVCGATESTCNHLNLLNYRSAGQLADTRTVSKGRRVLALCSHALRESMDVSLYNKC